LDDLKFVSGEFFNLVLPKEKRYFLKYFTKDQLIFLYYYDTFRSIDRFTNHTGVVFSRRWLRILKNRYKQLEQEYQQAKEIGDFSKIAEIQSGKLPVYRESHGAVKRRRAEKRRAEKIINSDI
jgi:hypothetical protein